MAENWLTKVARIAIHAAQGLTWTDKNNEVQVIKPEGKSNFLNIQKIVDGIGSGGGDTGGGDNPNTNGVNYIPASLEDGTLTGRKVEWTGTTSSTDVTTAKFSDDLGTLLNLAGDGLQFKVYMTKTLVTRGVVGDSSNISIAYDEDNEAINGKYVTTQYLPVSINKKNLIDGNEIKVIFDGIGEGDISAVETHSPELHFKYNPGQNSIDISQVSGYAFDNLSDTKTGQTYDIGVSMINTFYVQKPVAQYPSTVQLFSGLAAGYISLSGIDSYYSNVLNGIEITIDNQMQSSSSSSLFADYSSFKLSQTIRIPKKELIIGNKVNFDVTGDAVVAKDDASNLADSTTAKIRIGSRNDSFYLHGLKNSFIEIGSGQIQFNLIVLAGLYLQVGWNDNPFIAKVSKITPY